MTRAAAAGRLLALALSLVLLPGCSPAGPEPSPTPAISTPAISTPAISTSAGASAAAAFAHSLGVEPVLQHLTRLQAVAEANGGNRAFGTAGFEASAAYLEEQLQAAGYRTSRESFQITTETVQESSVRQLAPEQAELDAQPLQYSPQVEVTAPASRPVEPSGCTEQAWQGVRVSGTVAVVDRGGCAFVVKSRIAHQLGAVGLIIINTSPGVLSGTLGQVSTTTVATFGVDATTGRRLLDRMERAEVTLQLVLRTITAVSRTGFNVIAETEWVPPGRVLMVGAHLDSVTAGPGMNDNASGSAAILQVALALAAQRPALVNRVRFAWWGGEELGLLGSAGYAESLRSDPAELARLAGYLNFDMIASPNFLIGVHDPREAEPAVPEGSQHLMDAFTGWFALQNQPWQPVRLDARSDHASIAALGVPVGGLFTGAEGTKTAAQVALFGGTADAPFDPNYHTARDTISNVSTEALAVTVPAIGFAVHTLAMDAAL